MWLLSSLRGLRSRWAQSIICRPRTVRPARRKNLRLALETLEDRLAPAAVTVLASDLRTAEGLPEYVRVAETSTGNGNGTDFTFNSAPDTYHLTDFDGGATYGSFTVAHDGTISGTTGALTASGSTIDFDLTKLAAVTIFGAALKDTSGSQLPVNIQYFIGFSGADTDTVYFPACTVHVSNPLSGLLYGTFTVADDGSGSVDVTATMGEALATDPYTIHFSPSYFLVTNLNGSGNDVLTGNFIGTDVTGESVAANNNGITSNSAGNTIGGASPGDRNIISGNNSGLPDAADGGSRPSDIGFSVATGAVIEGNYIGAHPSRAYLL